MRVSQQQRLLVELPRLRIIVYFGRLWGPAMSGNSHMNSERGVGGLCSLVQASRLRAFYASASVQGSKIQVHRPHHAPN